eukprot:357076-Chlamydomonas_euryale.AAC.4
MARGTHGTWDMRRMGHTTRDLGHGAHECMAHGAHDTRCLGHGAQGCIAAWMGHATWRLGCMAHGWNMTAGVQHMAHSTWTAHNGSLRTAWHTCGARHAVDARRTACG